MKKIPCFILLVVFFLIPFSDSISAQEQKENDVIPVKVSLDIVSRFVWRGVSLSQSPSLQPMVEFHKGAFSLLAFGSYTASIENNQNTNFIASYTYKNITIKLADYFSPNDSVGAIHNYFNYSSNTTKHLYDAQIIIKGGEKIPLSMLFSSFIYGNDKKKGSTLNNYSSYIEMAYDFSKNNVDYSAFAGVTLWDGFYGSKFGLANIGISAAKKIKLSDDLQIPIKVNLSTNLLKNNIYFVGIVSL